ncbi:hypothetical protein AB9K41_15205 [Cribrihabitans sp. XS_ASV171]
MTMPEQQALLVMPGRIDPEALQPGGPFRLHLEPPQEEGSFALFDDFGQSLQRSGRAGCNSATG